ncbi:MAG: alpha/beta hydrolase [Clostridiales bacterium]|nr:alpha/beta hydrolase [Clostridiales bacterium]
MFIMDDGIRLNAKLDMPREHGEKCPLVIVIHGFTGHMEERHIVAVAQALNEIGFATLRVDMYGHGNSDGKFEDHTLYKWLTNALTVIDYARSLDFVTDIWLCGHSQGGMTVMLAGAMKRDVIRGLIPLSPAWMIPEGARNGTLLGQTFDPYRIPDVLPAWGDRGLGGNYVRVAQTIHVEEAIDRYTGPVLIVHGDQDEAVPVEYGIRAAERYRNCKLVLIPGDTHCYDYHLDQVLDAVKTWMRKAADKKTEI